MQKKTSIVAIGLFAAAGFAQDYSIVAFDHSDQSLNLINVPNSDPGQVSVSNLFNFADADTRVLRIDRAPSGRFYMDNSPFPPTDPNEAGLIQVDSLFGVPNASFLSQGDDRFSIGSGVRFDGGRGQVVTMQLPSSTHQDPRYFGVLGVNPNNAALTNILEEDRNSPPPRPRWQRGADLVQDINSNDYYVVALNGGIFEDPNGPGDPPDRNFGSTLHRMSIDGNLVGSEELVVDLSDTAVTGLNRPINFARGIDINPGNGDIYIADGEGSIFTVTLDGNGDFDSITEIVSGLLAERPDALVYNQFNDKLLFNTARGDSLYQVNLDGSDLEVVLDNFDSGGIFVIPSPSTLAMIGIGTLFAARRRRA